MRIPSNNSNLVDVGYRNCMIFHRLVRDFTLLWRDGLCISMTHWAILCGIFHQLLQSFSCRSCEQSGLRKICECPRFQSPPSFIFLYPSFFSHPPNNTEQRYTGSVYISSTGELTVNSVYKTKKTHQHRSL